MTPFKQAGEFCDREMPPFERWLVKYHERGYVFSSPEFFICGRPVDSSFDGAFFLDPATAFPRESQDAWFVFLGAGDISKALSFLPYRLPWVIFYRKDGELRKYPMARFESFLSLANGSAPPQVACAE